MRPPGYQCTLQVVGASSTWYQVPGTAGSTDDDTGLLLAAVVFF